MGKDAHRVTKNQIFKCKTGGFAKWVSGNTVN